MNFEDILPKYKEKIINDLISIISIKSVDDKPLDDKPFGEGIDKCLKQFLEISRNLGFTTENIDGYVGEVRYGEGENVIGILCHLDVVPEGKDWDFDPYSGAISNGKLYGRGAIDDKGPAIASLYAIKLLEEKNKLINRKMNKTVKLILGTNEEKGSRCIKYYLTKKKEPDLAFTPDGEFPVISGEKGIIFYEMSFDFFGNSITDCFIDDIYGGNAPNMVPDYACATIYTNNINSLINQLKEIKDIKYEKIDNKIKLEVYGKSAHGSLPEKGENAISKLIKILSYINITDEKQKRFINFYNTHIGMNYNGENIGLGFKDEISGKLTYNVGLISKKDNKIILTIDIRYPISIDFNIIKERIIEYGRDLYEFNLINHIKPIYVDKNDILIKSLLSAYSKVMDIEKPEPKIIGGGTYARNLKKCVAFGPVFPNDEELAHQKNEYIEIEKLFKMVLIYAYALEKLCFDDF